MDKKQIIKPSRLKGFNDYLPEMAQLKFLFMDRIRKIADGAGFLPIQTPSIEYAETLLGEGGETDKQVYKFLDNGEREVALRYDLTVPFSRFAAENFSKLIMPFKRFEMGQVFRAEKPQKGRYREFCQCDFDIIGIQSEMADIEILKCLSDALASLDVGEIEFVINNRVVLSALIAHFLPAHTDKEVEILIALDKLDKIGFEGVRKILSEIEGMDTPGAAGLLNFIETSTQNSGEQTFGELKRLFTGNEAAINEVERLETTLGVMTQIAQDSVTFRLNLSIARGLAYYTGIVFESSLKELPDLGSICSGGRYDNLAARFTKQELQGVGGSIGLDRLVAGIVDKKTWPVKNCDAYIAIATVDAVSYGFQLLSRLRNEGWAVDICLKPGRKLAQQLRHANRIDARFVAILGSAEVESETYVLKDMLKEEEFKNIKLPELIDIIAQNKSKDEQNGLKAP